MSQALFSVLLFQRAWRQEAVIMWAMRVTCPEDGIGKEMDTDFCREKGRGERWPGEVTHKLCPERWE